MVGFLRGRYFGEVMKAAQKAYGAEDLMIHIEGADLRLADLEYHGLPKSVLGVDVLARRSLDEPPKEIALKGRGSLNGQGDLVIRGFEERTRALEGIAMSEAMVPRIRSAGYEWIAEDILQKYCVKALYAPMPLPIDDLMRDAGLRVTETEELGDLKGAVAFGPCVLRGTAEMARGDILVDSGSRNPGQIRFTKAHEFVHWLYHQMSRVIACPKAETPARQGKEARIMERQANGIGAAILMPRYPFVSRFREILRKEGADSGYGRCLSELADCFQVSRQAADYRLRRLGVFPGAEDRPGVYAASFDDVSRASLKDPGICGLLQDGKVLYVDGVLVLNSPKYVAGAHLTAYAAGHLDECAFAFRPRGCVLSRGATEDRELDDGAENGEKKNRAESFDMRADALFRAAAVRARMDGSFSLALRAVLDEYGAKKSDRTPDIERVAEETGLPAASLRDWLRKRRMPGRKDVLRICCILKLPPLVAFRLLRAAGFGEVEHCGGEPEITYRALILTAWFKGRAYWEEKLSDRTEETWL